MRVDQAIIKAHRGGFFSLLGNVLTCLEIYDNIKVDWSTSAYEIPAEFADRNLWNYFFLNFNEPLDGSFDVWENYPHQKLTYKNVAQLYQGSQSWRWMYHGLWKRIELRYDFRNLQKDAAHIYQEMTGIIIRSHPHAGEQISDKSQPLDEYAREIEKANTEKVFVMSGDEESLAWFRERFNCISHPVKRMASRNDDHFSHPVTLKDAIEVFGEALALSACRTIIHPVSNISTFALIANPRAKSVFLP